MVCNSLSINELRGTGGPAAVTPLGLTTYGTLPEDFVLTVLAHRGDVELLETQRVLEGGEQNGVATGGATLRGDCLTAVDASDGGDGGLQFRSLGCRYWCPVHNFFSVATLRRGCRGMTATARRKPTAHGRRWCARAEPCPAVRPCRGR